MPAGAQAGLFVCEMITSRGIVERDRKTQDMLQFDPGERVRSVQLYGVDPVIMGRATEILINDFAVDHVDLNFGCPVPKVTRKGGGAALPYKRRWLELILTAVVGAAAPYGVPVTMKTRIGIDHDHQTHLDAGRIAEQSGCAAIALHGRTAQQAYSGEADWDAIAALKQHVSIPVLGNGDIWEAARRAGDGAADRCGRRGDRPRLSRSAVAVPGPGGRLRRGADADPAHPRRGGDHGPAACGAAGGLQRRGARAGGDAQAHGLVLQGLPGRGRPPARARTDLQLRRSGRRAGAARSGRTVPDRRAGLPAGATGCRRARRWLCPSTGWTIRWRSISSWPTPSSGSRVADPA